MASPTALITSAFTDVVGVFTPDFKQVFVGARPLKASVNEQSKPMEHPLETGATITDHRIILPVEIELSMILQAADYKTAYQQIKQLFTAGTLLTVQTYTDTYTNQLIATLPHEEDPALFNTITMGLKLKEAQFVTAQFGTTVVPRNPANSSTVARGNQQPQTASAEQTTKASALYGLIT